MKVLHILQSTRFSGAENVVCQIVEMSKKRDDLDMLYCSPDGQIREALKERGIKYRAIREISVKEIKEVIREYCPDVIHAHDRSACVVAAMASKKIPIIAHIHVNNNIGVSSLIKNIIWTLFVKKYRHIFWVSDSAYSQFQCKKLVQEKSSVLYNVIDMQSLCKKADKDDLTYDYDVVYVGRLSYQKDPERLMHILHNACIKEKGLKVAIVGNGEYEQYVMDYIQSHELVNNIDYLGYLNNPLKLVKMSKVLLMTSRFEGTPMVALEAQCLGVPVVSTPVDGMKKIIINGYNGYLVDNDDELIKHLIEITSNAEKQKELSRNSLMQAIKYNDLNKYYDAIMHRYNSK